MKRTVHELKIWPAPFSRIMARTKTYEIRTADRHFRIGDAVKFREWDPKKEKFTGHQVHARIEHVTKAGTWGLPKDLCVFGIKVII